MPTYLGEANNRLYSRTSIYGVPVPSESEAKRLFYARRTLATTSIALDSNWGLEEIVSQNGKRSEFHNCTHARQRGANLPFLLLWLVKGRLQKVEYYRRSTIRPYRKNLADTVSGLVSEYSPGGDPFFSGRAFWSMRPKFQGEVSLINSVFELKDFKDVLHPTKVVRSIRDLISGKAVRSFMEKASKSPNALGVTRVSNNRDYDGDIIPQAAATIKNAAVGSFNLIPSSTSAMVRSTTGMAASAQLTLSLAIKPTIADVLAIIANAQRTAMDAQKMFHDYGNDGSVSHFSETALRSDQLTRCTGNNYVYAEGSTVKVVRTATMRSFYEYKMRSHNQALQKYWGLTGTVDALWNMLPLSFVLDYVFTVGKVLEYMRRDDNVLHLRTEYCESVKLRATDGLHIVQDSRVPALLIDGEWYPSTSKETSHLISGTEYTRYQRSVVPPYKGPALPKFKVPSGSQGMNLLALARVILF